MRVCSIEFRDAFDELLTLQLHLEGLSRVGHDEGVRLRRLAEISGSYFGPFGVKGVRGTPRTWLAQGR